MICRAISSVGEQRSACYLQAQFTRGTSSAPKVAIVAARACRRSTISGAGY